MPLKNTTLQVRLDGGETKSLAGINVDFPMSCNFSPAALTDGTAINNAQKAVKFSGSVTAGAPVTHDLSTMVGPFATVNFSAIKDLIIVITSDNGTHGDLIVGNAASNQFTGPMNGATNTQNVANDGAGNGVMVWSNHSAAGWAVDGTHKSLKIDASAGTVNYDIYLVGEGA